MIDCAAPIDEARAATMLASHRHSDTLLQNLRSWAAMLRVSTMVLAATRNDTVRLADAVQAAQTH